MPVSTLVSLAFLCCRTFVFGSDDEGVEKDLWFSSAQKIKITQTIMHETHHLSFSCCSWFNPGCFETRSTHNYTTVMVHSIAINLCSSPPISSCGSSPFSRLRCKSSPCVLNLPLLGCACCNSQVPCAVLGRSYTGTLCHVPIYFILGNIPTLFTGGKVRTSTNKNSWDKLSTKHRDTLCNEQNPGHFRRNTSA